MIFDNRRSSVSLIDPVKIYFLFMLLALTIGNSYSQAVDSTNFDEGPETLEEVVHQL